MIDFKLNEQGDIVLEKNKAAYPKFRLDFAASASYPKLRINFYTTGTQQPNNGIKINFDVDNSGSKQAALYVSCVRDKEQTAQAIAVRLQTELNELKHFYAGFGSELIRLRHEDLLNQGNHDYIREYVRKAISDLSGINNYAISVKRVKTGEGNFQVENLTITISDTDNDEIFSCNF